MTEPAWLDAMLVRAVHAELLAEHGGLDARIDEGLLEATLARPRQKHHCSNPPPILAELAAAYGFGFARNHCFSDGNKRIALAAIDVFLQLNGSELVVPEPDAVFTIEDLAAGALGEEALSLWIARCARTLPDSA